MDHVTKITCLTYRYVFLDSFSDPLGLSTDHSPSAAAAILRDDITAVNKPHLSAMGNGAKAQQKRERGAKDAKKGPTSQLKTVSAHEHKGLLLEVMATDSIPTECISSDRQVQDMPPNLSDHSEQEGIGSACFRQTWQAI